MEILVRHRESLEKEDLPGQCVIVSITDPHSPPVRLRDPAKARAILRLSFYDLDEPIGDWPVMQSDHARAIWEFAEEWKEAVPHLIIQCESGVSRSPAIAGALSMCMRGNPPHALNGPDPFDVDNIPNRHCRNLVIRAAVDWYRKQGHPVVWQEASEPKISVCIRVKYPTDRLLAMLLCLRRQRHKNWEAIVVTDGPNAGARDTVHSIDDERVSLWETPESKGLWGAPYRQEAIARCTGEYVGLTNDDNYYVPGYFELMLRQLRAENADLVLCDMVHSYGAWSLLRAEPRPGFCDLGNWIAKAELVKATSWSGVDWGSDGRAVQRMAAQGKVTIIRKPLFIHN